VSSGEPDHPDRGPVRRDAPGVRVGLAEAEQRVLGALHEEGGRLDPVQDGRRAAAVEDGGDLGRQRPGGGSRLVRPADVGAEPATGEGLLDRARIERGQVGGVRLGRAPAAGAGGAAEGVQQSAGRDRPHAEEQPGPQPLEDAGTRGLGRDCGGSGIRLAGLGGEEGCGERVPGDLRRDRVDPVVVRGAEQRGRTAVGAARDAHPRVTLRVELHLVPVGQEVDQGGEVGDLVARVVQPDLPGAPAEATGRVRQDDVTALREILRVGGHRLLAAAEAVREDHGRSPVVARREVEGRVQLDRVGPEARGHPRLLGPHRVVGGGGRGRQAEQEADGEQEGEDCGRRAGAGARAGTHEPAEGAHEAANGRHAIGVPATAPELRAGAQPAAQPRIRAASRPSSRRRDRGPAHRPAPRRSAASGPAAAGTARSAGAQPAAGSRRPR
jgi:hypothetical protein